MRLIDADVLLHSTDKECIHAYEIALAPTIEAEPVRHGYWEYHTRHQRDCVASCSICRKRTTFFFKSGTKYCPFCGAKMDGERREEND